MSFLLYIQSENLRDPKVEVKEEIKEEDGVIEKQHKDLYQDIMEDSSSYRNPPERCPRPLYSRDSTQEDHTIPHHHQSRNLGDDNIDVKEEYKEENEEYGVMEDFSEGHKDMMEPPNTRNPPERWVSTQQDHTIPYFYKAEDLMDIKVEAKAEEEETYVRDDQQSMEEDGITGTFIEEDTPTEISTEDGREMRKTSEDCLTLSPDCKVEDEDITQYSPGENPTTSNVHPAPHSVDGPSYSSYPEEPQTVRDGAGPSYSSYPEEPQTVRDGAGPSYSSYPEEPQTVRDGAGPSYSSYPEEPQTVRDGAVFLTHKRFSCPECGKCFLYKSALNEHIRSHTGEKPYFCPECGKCFSRTSNLYTHRRLHTGEKLHSCSECRKCFVQKSDLVIHQRSHSGEKPYSCPECEKCFSQRSNLSHHQRSHTGEKPYSCHECGKCFSVKFNLYKHQRLHTGEKQFSSSKYRNCHSQKSSVYSHLRLDTEENELSWSD
ncbi:uncharacterized protein [Aquarana catesbeiana]|uniref:uncharacterized protein n=1 Tax=Aquarana catesbeiana TaxID=8400 RepID=UPI003CC9A0D9